MSFKVGDRVQRVSGASNMMAPLRVPFTITYISDYARGYACGADQFALGVWLEDLEHVVDEKVSTPANGVWVVRSGEYGQEITSVHASELDALRTANTQGYGKADFVEFS